MATTINKTTAAANFPLDGIGANNAPQKPGMRVMDARAKITLRGKTDDNAFTAAAKKALGFALPDVVGKSANNEGRGGASITALCLGPDEWMLWAADENRETLLANLHQSMDGVFAAIVDVSDYYTIIRLDDDKTKGKAESKTANKAGDKAGGNAESKAEDIIASGCPLDIATMQPGDCAQSHHGAAQILIHRTPSAFDLQVRISMAPHLHKRLQTAME